MGKMHVVFTVDVSMQPQAATQTICVASRLEVKSCCAGYDPGSTVSGVTGPDNISDLS